jgi:transcriptional regulator with XRE-family HTH domain
MTQVYPARDVLSAKWVGMMREHPGDTDHLERLGRRIAAHRAKLGWTQQELAERLAVSRVAVSHLERGVSAPGERTVALLAGLFKVTPHELVTGTDYPAAKADRLPVVVAQYTEVELQLHLFDADVRWLEELRPAHAEKVLAAWDASFTYLAAQTHDARERAMVESARARVRALIAQQRDSA